MATLSPAPGFDWSRVRWGAPDAPRSEQCSYCDAPLGAPEEPDYEVPLIIWRADGSAAEFCMVCQEQWWGLWS